MLENSNVNETVKKEQTKEVRNRELHCRHQERVLIWTKQMLSGRNTNSLRIKNYIISFFICRTVNRLVGSEVRLDCIWQVNERGERRGKILFQELWQSKGAERRRSVEGVRRRQGQDIFGFFLLVCFYLFIVCFQYGVKLKACLQAKVKKPTEKGRPEIQD